ncbi:glycoside hydrolase family 18 [Lecanosticta acicola]|uniref:chitinase n=1 Tax=Lecanosticta acicola TaxID=111012 RepID=A0AAI8YV99_9PEZI|nr:glycoside hydrolase family 18 [Lecanosticta acicola]
MRLLHTTAAAAASTALLLAHQTTAAGFSATNTLSVYWGQNSYGQNSGALAQQGLASYCQNAAIDVINMAFVVKINSGKGGQPEINLANSGVNCTIFNNTNLWDCGPIGADIKTCQKTYNKTILMSIGGAAYTEAGFSSANNATAAANLMWNMFGPVNSSSPALRPFHDAVVDGFDLDPEQKSNYFRAFGLQLRALMNANTSKPWYLTTAPQCPYPDPNIDPMLNDPRGGVPFDAVYIQFYNNPSCDLSSFNASLPTTSSQPNCNLATWNAWAQKNSANKNVKLFVGAPAAPGAANTGYLTAAQLQKVIAYGKGFSNFGGVMVWDASQAYANQPWLGNVKTDLNGAAAKKQKRRRRRGEGAFWRRRGEEVEEVEEEEWMDGLDGWMGWMDGWIGRGSEQERERRMKTRGAKEKCNGGGQTAVVREPTQELPLVTTL